LAVEAAATTQIGEAIAVAIAAEPQQPTHKMVIM
jgi:hypothetical protein